MTIQQHIDQERARRNTHPGCSAFGPSDLARADRKHLIAVTEPRTPSEQQALDAALFERTKAERYELAMRRALFHLDNGQQFCAKAELQSALLSIQ